MELVFKGFRECLQNLAEELRKTERLMVKLAEKRKNNMVSIRDSEQINAILSIFGYVL